MKIRLMFVTVVLFIVFCSGCDDADSIRTVAIEACNEQCEINFECDEANIYGAKSKSECFEFCDGTKKIDLTDSCDTDHELIGFSTPERCLEASELGRGHLHSLDDCLKYFDQYLELADLLTGDDQQRFELYCGALHSDQCFDTHSDYLACLEENHQCLESPQIPERCGLELKQMIEDCGSHHLIP